MRGLNRKLREIAIGLGVFGLLVAAGVLAQVSAHATILVVIVVGCGLIVALLTAVDRRPARRTHDPGKIASVTPLNTGAQLTATPTTGPRVTRLQRPWIIDGDTIDDRALRIRFRVAGIDAPETKPNAACDAEAHMGERAKWRAFELIKAAKIVEAHASGELDLYGRVVARIKLDGADLGDALVSEGYAIPLSGQRQPWCGAPLNALAHKRYGRPICLDCAHAKQQRPS